MAAVAEDKDAYRAGFERFAAAHAASDPAWLRERRTAAIARFVERGLPDRSRRGVAPHAGRPRSRRGASFRPTPPREPPRTRSPRCPARASAGRASSS